MVTLMRNLGRPVPAGQCDQKKLQKTRFKLHPLYLPAQPKLANWSELCMIDS